MVINVYTHHKLCLKRSREIFIASIAYFLNQVGLDAKISQV